MGECGKNLIRIVRGKTNQNIFMKTIYFQETSKQTTTTKQNQRVKSIDCLESQLRLGLQTFISHPNY